MQPYKENLGKVAITIDPNYYNPNKDYSALTIVYIKDEFVSYISRKPVPATTPLTDRRYWIPFSSLKEEIQLDYNKLKEEYINKINDLKDTIKELKTLKDFIEILLNSEDITALYKDIEEIKKELDNKADTLDFVDIQLICETEEGEPNAHIDLKVAVKHEDNYYDNYYYGEEGIGEFENIS